MFLSFLLLLKSRCFFLFKWPEYKKAITYTKLVYNSLKLHKDDRIEKNDLNDALDKPFQNLYPLWIQSPNCTENVTPQKSMIHILVAIVPSHIKLCIVLKHTSSDYIISRRNMILKQPPKKVGLLSKKTPYVKSC